MSYRNKTYVILDYDEDNKYYNLLKAWKENESIGFDFFDAHEMNTLRAISCEETVKRKLYERMKNSKQAVVLVGEKTKNLHRYVRWEIEKAIEMDIPIIATNLNKKNREIDLTPPILKSSALFISVPFGLRPIKYALDNFPGGYRDLRKTTRVGSRYYPEFDNFQ